MTCFPSSSRSVRPADVFRRLLSLPAVALATVVGGLAGAGTLAAQDVEERFPGVSLGLTYEARSVPTIAIQPFTGRMGGGAVAPRVENIVARDLPYSNRFNVMADVPSVLVPEDGEVDYALWDEMGATWLITGRVEGAGTSAVLVLELHDVIYRQVHDSGRFRLPQTDTPDFRMAVHVASDAIVRWVFDEPGIAASRIVFSRRMEDGSQDLWIVDSDGENLRRVTNHRDISLSPTWSPDGRRVAYTSYLTGVPRIYELNLETGEEREIPALREGDYITPAYHPDGEVLAFSVVGGGRSGIYTYDIVRDCCFTNLTEGRWDDISPSFNPDGSELAFNSNRLGVGSPQIYQMPYRAGGSPSILSPYLFETPGYYTSPDWAPVGNRIAYHGRVERRGEHQILVSELDERNRVVRLTLDGVNEDPSWAPDGRHLVHVGARSWGWGLFVTDAVTGRTRTLVTGIRPNLPAWSPSLAPLLAEEE